MRFRVRDCTADTLGYASLNAPPSLVRNASRRRRPTSKVAVSYRTSSSFFLIHPIIINHHHLDVSAQPTPTHPPPRHPQAKPIKTTFKMLEARMQTASILKKLMDGMSNRTRACDCGLIILMFILSLLCSIRPARPIRPGRPTSQPSPASSRKPTLNAPRPGSPSKPWIIHTSPWSRSS